MLDDFGLLSALRRNEFFIAYQPLFNSRSHLPECMEALLRWQQPGRGTIPPDQFIHHIEGHAIEAEFIEWMLQTSWAAHQQWLVQQHDIAVAINVSPTMLTGELVEIVELNWPDLPRLEIEVTERLPVLNPSEAGKTVTALRERGVHVLFDDFCGTGHCINRLALLPFSGVKIDRSMVPPPPDYGTGELIRLSSLAGQCNLITTAEGMEHVEQILVAQLAGIHRWQGYFGSRPMTREESVTWISSRAYRSIHTAIHRYSSGTRVPA